MWLTTVRLFVALATLARCCHGIIFGRRIPLTTRREDFRISAFDPDPSEREWLRFLSVEESFVLLGARDEMYNVSLSDMTITSSLTVPPEPSGAIYQQRCSIDMRSIAAGTAQCHNFIRAALYATHSDVTLCGSNAGRAACWSFYYDSDRNQWIQNRSASNGMEHISPFFAAPLPWLNTSTFVADTGSAYFGGCILDRQIRFRCLIFRGPTSDDSLPSLSTSYTMVMIHSVYIDHEGVPIDSRIYPNFVASFETAQYVYWIFSEGASELAPFIHRSASRIARVCKNDRSNPVLSEFSYVDGEVNYFATFWKTTLECSFPGKFLHTDENSINRAGYHTFYFNSIAGASKLGIGSIYTDGRRRIKQLYGVFNTEKNSIRGSAICAYDYEEIERAFNGPLYLLNSKNQDYIPSGDVQLSWEVRNFVSHSSYSLQKPTQCDDTRNRTDSEKYMGQALLARNVMPLTGRPIFFQTEHKYLMTHMVVDWQLRAQDGRHYDVLHVGTDDGQVLKLANIGGLEHPDFNLIESRSFSSDSKAVGELSLTTLRGQMRQKVLLVNTFDSLLKLPVESCHEQATCDSCVALRDPYCSWDLDLRKCVPSYNSALLRRYVQNIMEGRDSRCAATGTLPSVLAAVNMTRPSSTQRQASTSVETPGVSKITATPPPNTAASSTTNPRKLLSLMPSSDIFSTSRPLDLSTARSPDMSSASSPSPSATPATEASSMTFKTRPSISVSTALLGANLVSKPTVPYSTTGTSMHRTVPVTTGSSVLRNASTLPQEALLSTAAPQATRTITTLARATQSTLTLARSPSVTGGTTAGNVLAVLPISSRAVTLTPRGVSSPLVATEELRQSQRAGSSTVSQNRATVGYPSTRSIGASTTPRFRSSASAAPPVSDTVTAALLTTQSQLAMSTVSTTGKSTEDKMGCCTLASDAADVQETAEDYPQHSAMGMTKETSAPLGATADNIGQVTIGEESMNSVLIPALVAGFIFVLSAFVFGVFAGKRRKTMRAATRGTAGT